MYKTLKDYWGNSPLISSDIDDDKSKGSNDDSDVELPNERTSLNRQGTVVMTPSQAARRGFSAGFVNFFESRGGMVFGFANLALYYASAIIAFSFYFEPDWTVIDAIYFATVTFTTIGTLYSFVLGSPFNEAVLFYESVTSFIARNCPGGF